MTDIAFTPIRQARASGEIVSQIEHAIFEGELKRGDRLESERELAERFGVSRITVRDALRVLEARGLVHVKVGASGGANPSGSTTTWPTTARRGTASSPR